MPEIKLRIAKKKPQSKIKKVLNSKNEDYPFEQIVEYNQIPLVPIVQLDLDANPNQLLCKMQNKYFHFGAVLLRSNWDIKSYFKSHSMPITTRIQKLSQLTKGQNFQQKIEAYSVQSFIQMAKKFELNYQVDDLEEEYWRLISDSTSTLQVEYAADLPSKKFGSAFPQYKFQSEYYKHQFNLNNVNSEADSLFQVIRSKREQISGVTSPWVYMGMMFSTFCWHTEDMYLTSLNYHHEGAPKTWYVIPTFYKEQFDEYVSEKMGKLNSIVLQIDPLELIKNKIPVYKCQQEAKDFVFTFPKVYHMGFSHGWNLTEAINTLLPINASFLFNSLNQQKLPIFPYEWPLIGVLEKLGTVKFTRENFGILFEEIKLVINREEILRKRKKGSIIRSNANYYQNQCKICQRYCYLSYMSCNECRWKCCIRHNEICPQIGHKTQMIERYSIQTLRKMLKKLEKLL